MEKAFKSRIFWIIFTLATLVIFAFLVNFSRVWKAETEVLIVAKNDLTAKNFEGIINDSLYVPESFSFYEKIISESSSLEDDSKKLSLAERQSSWEKKIFLERVDHSGIIKISISDSDRNRAEEISRQAALTLANYLAKDYNIKTELDAKIINGPISARAISLGFLSSLSLSAFLGAIIAFSFSRAIFNFETPQVALPVSLKEILGKKEKLIFWEGQPFEIEKMEISKSKEIKIEKKEEVKKETKAEILSQKASISTMTFSPGKKAVAPENLPISEEEARFLAETSFEPFEPEEKNEEVEKAVVEEIAEPQILETKEDEVSKDIFREPTEEEVRERMLKLEKVKNSNPSAEEAKEKLNKLLEGKI